MRRSFKHAGESAVKLEANQAHGFAVAHAISLFDLRGV